MLNHYSKIVLVGFTLTLHLMGSVLHYLQPVSAASLGVVIARVQTGGSGSGTASQELISLYNSSAHDVEVSDWCVEYSSGSNGQGFSKLSCMQSGYESVGLWLGAGSWVHFGTLQFFELTSLPIDFYYTASLAASSGHVRLLDASGLEVDRLGWGEAIAPEGVAAIAHSSGQVLSRKITSGLVDSDNNFLDFESVVLSDFIAGTVFEQEVILDLCSNLEGVQIEVPSGFEREDETGECWQLQQLEDAPLQVTELYPNAPSYDTGQEFIEIYNPTERSVSLVGYVLQVGQSYSQSATLHSGLIEAGGYIAISDLQSGVTLPNTSGNVRLLSPAGNMVSESSVYGSPSELFSWALVGGLWQYTNQITPGLPNLPSLEESEENASSVGATQGVSLVACPLGKVRNPATNRCRTVGSTQAQLLACDGDEYRSPETNRCRKLVDVTGNLVACKPGQVRNPSTSRCKVDSAAGSELAPCKVGQERNPETNRCRKAPVTLGASSDGGLSDITDVAVPSSGGQYVWAFASVLTFSVIGYMVYEWRSEITRVFSRIRFRILAH